METSSALEPEQRRRIVLIAAAAATAIGAPIRVLDIRLAHQPASRWLKGGRGVRRTARRPVWLHRPAELKKEGEQPW
jgi:hypothetical protein